MSIFVGNLPFRAEQEDVIELFAPFGEVANCALPLERDTGRKRGFAFVEMADESAEPAAIEALQGAEMMGRPLRINKAEPRGSAPRRGGGGGGKRNRDVQITGPDEKAPMEDNPGEKATGKRESKKKSGGGGIPPSPPGGGISPSPPVAPPTSKPTMP